MALQYSPGLSALAVCLTDYQHLPYRRSAELICVLAGNTLSPATLVGMEREASAHLAAIGQSVVRSAVAHANETGMRVAGHPAVAACIMHLGSDVLWDGALGPDRLDQTTSSRRPTQSANREGGLRISLITGYFTVLFQGSSHVQ